MYLLRRFYQTRSLPYLIRQHRIHNKLLSLQNLINQYTHKGFNPDRTSIFLLSEIMVSCRDPKIEDLAIESLMLKTANMDGITQVIPLLGVYAIKSQSPVAQSCRQYLLTCLLRLIPNFTSQEVKRLVWNLQHCHVHLFPTELRQVLSERLKTQYSDLTNTELAAAMHQLSLVDEAYSLIMTQVFNRKINKLQKQAIFTPQSFQIIKQKAQLRLEAIILIRKNQKPALIKLLRSNEQLLNEDPPIVFNSTSELKTMLKSLYHQNIRLNKPQSIYEKLLQMSEQPAKMVEALFFMSKQKIVIDLNNPRISNWIRKTSTLVTEGKHDSLMLLLDLLIMQSENPFAEEVLKKLLDYLDGLQTLPGWALPYLAKTAVFYPLTPTSLREKIQSESLLALNKGQTINYISKILPYLHLLSRGHKKQKDLILYEEFFGDRINQIIVENRQNNISIEPEVHEAKELMLRKQPDMIQYPVQNFQVFDMADSKRQHFIDVLGRDSEIKSSQLLKKEMLARRLGLQFTQLSAEKILAMKDD